MKNGRVLFIDDEREITEPYGNYLSDNGYEVAKSLSGEEALKILKKMKKNFFHVIVTDHNMPNINGLQLITAIKELKIEADIILASGFVDNYLSTNAHKLGVKEIICKPAPPSAIKNAIKSILEKKIFEKKSYYLDQLDTPVQIKLDRRKPKEIDDYLSGAEILECILNKKTPVRIASLMLKHLDVCHGMCLSVSWGCPKDCPKCFSGNSMPFKNHFTADEIVAMVKAAMVESYSYYDDRFWLYDLPFFIAIMGSGDIAFNFENTIQAMERVKKIFNKRFVCNISTAFLGGVEKLTKYVYENQGRQRTLIPNLQISLDSLNQRIRRYLIDSDENPIFFVEEAKNYYHLTSQLSKRANKKIKKITANFVVCKDINDTSEEIERIFEYLTPEIFRIKLSESDLPENSRLKGADLKVIEMMGSIIQNEGFEVEIFDKKKQMGFGIGGSCGTIIHNE